MKTEKEDRVSHLMVFCALMMVKNSSATMQQSMRLAALPGRGKALARELGKPVVLCESVGDLAS